MFNVSHWGATPWPGLAQPDMPPSLLIVCLAPQEPQTQEMVKISNPWPTCLGEGRNPLSQLSLHFWQSLCLTHCLLQLLLSHFQELLQVPGLLLTLVVQRGKQVKKECQVPSSTPASTESRWPPKESWFFPVQGARLPLPQVNLQNPRGSWPPRNSFHRTIRTPRVRYNVTPLHLVELPGGAGTPC